MPSQKTLRPTSQGAESVLGKVFPVLNHGYIVLRDYMGNDSEIANAARISYGKGTRKISEDTGLIRYLLRHRHTTPFEMAELKWECTMPIFVARQWIRHRTANVNETSLRYSEPIMDFYIPNPEDIRLQSKTNRQGGNQRVSKKLAEKVISILNDNTQRARADYDSMNQEGIARELARMSLPINLYTKWVWKNDLHNTMHFLSLRLDPHAQKEIRDYAEVMAQVVQKAFPISWKAFEDYQLNSLSLSAPEIQCLQRILSGKSPEKVIPQVIKNKREQEEAREKLIALGIGI